MKSVLLIGLGRFGRSVAQMLNELEHEVLAIDNVEERVNQVLPYVVNAQIGDSTDEEFMSSLGIEDFDLCIVAIGDNFQSSLETTLLLKELGAKFVVSRASQDVHAKFLIRNGADDVVYPEKEYGLWTALKYSSENLLNYYEMQEGYSLAEMKVPHKWIGKALGELDLRQKYNINVLAISRDNSMMFAVGTDTEFREGDKVLIVAHRDIIKELI